MLSSACDYLACDYCRSALKKLGVTAAPRHKLVSRVILLSEAWVCLFII